MEQIDRFFSPYGYYNDPRSRHPWMNTISSTPATTPDFGPANLSYTHYYQGTNSHGYSNTGYGAYYIGYQQQSNQNPLYNSNFSPHRSSQADFQPSHYQYQPSEFSHCWTAGVVPDRGYMMGSQSGNWESSFTSPQKSNTTVDGSIPVEFPIVEGIPTIIDNSTANFTTAAISEFFPERTRMVEVDYGLGRSAKNLESTFSYVETRHHQTISSPASGFAINSDPFHKVCVSETLNFSVTVACKTDNGPTDLELVIDVDGLEDNEVHNDEIELSSQPSPIVMHTKMGFRSHVQQVFDKMPTRVIDDSFYKLVSVSEDLIETRPLEMMKMVNAEPKSKVVGIPEVPLEEESSKEIELLKGVECPVLETQLELVVHPHNSDELDWQSESVNNAYCRNIHVNEPVPLSVSLEDMQAQNTHAPNGITGRVADSIIKSRKVYSLVKLVREEGLLLPSSLIAYALGGDIFRRKANCSLLDSAKKLKKKCCSAHENHMCLEGSKKTNLKYQVEKMIILEAEDIRENKTVVFKEIKNKEGTALDFPKAVTYLAASVSGEFGKMELMVSEKKLSWCRKLHLLLSVICAIVKILPLVQEFQGDGTPKIMVFQPLPGPYVSLPALKKLNVLLIDMIDNFSGCEFYCAYQEIIVSGENCFDILRESYARLEAHDATGRQEANSLLLCDSNASIKNDNTIWGVDGLCCNVTIKILLLVLGRNLIIGEFSGVPFDPGVVISLFLQITLEDKGGLMGKWFANFPSVHVQDQTVYACSSGGISNARSLFEHIFVAIGLHVVEGGQLEECSTAFTMLSRTLIEGIMANVVFVSFEELNKELMFMLIVLQAYFGCQKHYNEFEAAINELINMEHNLLCAYNEMFAFGYHKVHTTNLEVLNLQEITRALGEWTDHMLHEPVREAAVGKYTGFSDSHLSVFKFILHLFIASQMKQTVCEIAPVTVTNLVATISGEVLKMELLVPEKKLNWQGKMDLVLSIIDSVVELALCRRHQVVELLTSRSVGFYQILMDMNFCPWMINEIALEVLKGIVGELTVKFKSGSGKVIVGGDDYALFVNLKRLYEQLLKQVFIESCYQSLVLYTNYIKENGFTLYVMVNEFPFHSSEGAFFKVFKVYAITNSIGKACLYFESTNITCRIALVPYYMEFLDIHEIGRHYFRGQAYLLLLVWKLLFHFLDKSKRPLIRCVATNSCLSFKMWACDSMVTNGEGSEILLLLFPFDPGELRSSSFVHSHP